jgi:type VI protein secretion system component VasK
MEDYQPIEGKLQRVVMLAIWGLLVLALMGLLLWFSITLPLK